jgi:type IX secretion system substrate protein
MFLWRLLPLKGYKIYRNDALYTFVTDTFYGCQYINTCNPTAGNWFNITSFWITVKAVYNKDSLTSIVTDSVYMGGETIGIEQKTKSNKLTIYPNPTKDVLNVECEMVNEKTTLTITDMLGNVVKQMPLNTQHITFNISDLNEGVYNISLQSNEGVVNKRVVIVR